MPTVDQSLKSNVDTSGMDRATSVSSSPSPYVEAAQNNSVVNPLLRCPMPVVKVPSVDDIQMWSRTGQVPQYRVYPSL